MKKTSILTIAMIGLFSLPLFAQTEPGGKPTTAPAKQDSKLPDGGVEASFAIVSNYIFRGADLHKNYANQKQAMYGASTVAPAFQPSITFSTPIKGLSVNLWGSFAMVGRGDVDGDLVFQTSPGGTAVDFSTTPYSLGSYPTRLTSTSAISADGLLNTAGTAFEFSPGATGLYKETNGLARSDELDITIDYTTETKKGNIGFGIVHYGLQDVRSISPLTELYFSYALPFLTQVTFKVNAEIQNDSGLYYYNIGYADERKLSKTLSVNWGVGAGYLRTKDKQGVSDITATVGVSVAGFSVSVNAANRPDLHMSDDSDPNTRYSLAAFGGSNNRDGQIADPSKTSGLINAAINNAIQTTVFDPAFGTGNYVYTPRSKLPKTVFWVSAAYTVEL